MIKKLNSMPDYQARMPRQPHDLSARLGMSFSTGMITSPYQTMLHTGDKIHFNGNISCRFNPLILPFLGQVTIHMDYFFVPLSVMYTPAPSLFYQTDDLISSATNRISLRKDYFPLLDVDATLNHLTTNHSSAEFGGDSAFISTEPLYAHSFDCLGKQTVRMCDWFNINPVPLFGGTDTPNGNFTPWYLAAYHACYYLFPGYRNEDRERKQYHFNLDTHYADVSAFEDPDLFFMHYIDLDKDYFNSIKVSPIASSIGMLGDLNSSLPFENKFNAVNNYLNSYSAPSLTNPSVQNNSEFTQAYQGIRNSNVTTQQIRVMFAFEKLMRVIGRAEKTYEAQFLAHFGEKIPHDVMHNITHLGHDVCSLRPQAIISTANTYDSSTGNGSALGEYGGNGQVSFSGKKRTFKAPTHGVFICMMYAKPDFYYQTILSKLNDLSQPMKFWQPEYDRIGMQPLFAFESDGVPNTAGNDKTTRLGWQFAYEHFKRRWNRVSLAFRNPVEATGLVNSYNPWFLSKIPYCNVDGQWLSAPLPSSGVTSTGTIDWRNFKSTPTDLNCVMQVRYNPGWIQGTVPASLHTLFYTDPLIADFNMEIKDVNYMSEFGEPEL